MKEVSLTKGHIAIVDAADYGRVMQYRWCYTKRGYAKHDVWNGGDRYSIYLHRFVMDAKTGEYVDHVNHNKLDCRRFNLRICTHQQNLMNRNLVLGTASGYKGVTLSCSGRWKADIMKDGKHKHLGVFDTPEEAALAYNRAAARLFGEFALLNPVGEEKEISA